MTAQILVVEDNPDNMKLVTWALEDAGYYFQGAVTAENALVILEQHTFDLVLMDISLPGMNGKEATRLIRKRPKFAHLPIIAVTAHAIKGEEEDILASGVSALLTKPINEAELLAVIQSFLQKESTDV